MEYRVSIEFCEIDLEVKTETFADLESALSAFFATAAEVYREWTGEAGNFHGIASRTTDNYPLDPWTPGEPEFKAETVYTDFETGELFAIVTLETI